MPKYCVIVVNQSDHASQSPFAVGAQQVEYCEAADPETVERMVRRELSRVTNPDLYTWTITPQ